MKKRENKTRLVQFWMTESEYERLKKNADTVDKSLSRIIRNVLHQWNHSVEAERDIAAKQATEAF